jgi:hypothetical protein
MCAGLLGMQFGIFYLFGLNSIALSSRFGGPIGAIMALLIWAAVPVVTLWRVFSAHRKGRFAAVRREGLFVRNLGEMITLPWADCSMVALNDIQPWLKRRGEDQTISLRGLFDSNSEKKIFERVVAAARSGDDPMGPLAALSMARPINKHRLAIQESDRKTLIRIGVGILIAAFVLMFGGLFIGPPSNTLVCISGAMFWIGGIIALVGVWRSDAKR